MKIAVIGAGVGGLAAAATAAAQGAEVTLFEKNDTCGGKIHANQHTHQHPNKSGAHAIDAGPTVLTMPWVFRDLFAACGKDWLEYLEPLPITPVARHFWNDGTRLDLQQDHDANVSAIEAFAGAAEASRFVKWIARANRAKVALNGPFIASTKPNPVSLSMRMRSDLRFIKPFSDLMSALAGSLTDPRLLQLFGRYATYCGSSPYAAPATLEMIVAAELEGIFRLPGGMRELTQALTRLNQELGSCIKLSTPVENICSHGRGWRLSYGQQHCDVDAVIVNADPAALSAGCFGAELQQAVSPPGARSLSAMTWTWTAPPADFELSYHNVFFSADYAAEFVALFKHQQVPTAPTVYVCAQDRVADQTLSSGQEERLFALVNAPANGDTVDYQGVIPTCQSNMQTTLSACGWQPHLPNDVQVTTPTIFAQRFPATGGALYGPASHGWQATFRRQGQRTRRRGLYLAGGATHPGPGLPMAAMSGRLAASCALQDIASTSRWRPTVTLGGTWMR